jgi:hypothetical protein
VYKDGKRQVDRGFTVPDNTSPNYPDILGYITGGQRINMGVAQLAAAVRPRVVRAGRAFETILLIQNASDGEVDVTATLQLPETDAKKNKGRFVTKHQRLVVGLRPAEVGYVTLPVSCLPDTAVSNTYKLTFGIDSKPTGKPRRIRLNEGGGEVTTAFLQADMHEKLEELKKLTYSTAKSGLRGTGVEVPFSVMSGSLGQIVDLQPGWITLWTLTDHMDDRLLLERYKETLATQALPTLNRSRMFQPLLEETQLRFNAAGYSIKPIEAAMITKLLMLILEMAAPTEENYDYLGESHYNVSLLLKKGSSVPETVDLPYWCRALLHVLAKDERAMNHPEQIVTRVLYPELVRDAALHAFRMIKTVTGENLGSDADMQAYTEQLAHMLGGQATLDFTHVYLPLVLGGVVVYDRVVMPDENLGDILHQISMVLDGHTGERNADTELIFAMAENLISRALQKYGGYRP